ncbi:MAG: terpene cyclase/mutase family protein [Phycisphaerales bacterium]|jgi:squalene cyclase|nr:terpene cyclase/mutase family protein [Phycisphaerales bacterium]
MIADNHRRYERIIVLLTIACLFATPLMAQPAAKKPAKTPKKSKSAAKTVVKKTVAARKKTGGDDAPELTEKASQAIDKGLKYLLSAQKKDGSWDGDGKGARAVGITSLSLMAFMCKAQFPGFGPYAKPLDRAKDWLLKHAKERTDGYLGTTMYEHGLATLALSEMWGMTRDKKDDDAIKKALEKAVDVILRSQNPGGGWRYQPAADGGEDTSCTQTVFHALASARQAGIMVPNETIAKVVKYFKFAHNPESGGFTYSPNGRLKVTPACTAGGLYCAQLAGQRDSEMVAAALRYLKKLSPGIFNGGGHYYYAHYYAIQAVVQAGDKHYAEWYPQIRDALISKQQTNGAWHKGSTAYETPMAIIILATPHRYIPIYQR